MKNTDTDFVDGNEEKWGKNTWESLDVLHPGPREFGGPAIYLTDRVYRRFTWFPKGEALSAAPTWYRDLQLSWLGRQVHDSYQGGSQKLISNMIDFDKSCGAGKIHLIVSREKVGDNIVLVVKESPRREDR